ncbi:MAG: alpha/beta hydrolase [Myxococcota bacterium]|nr:alpha/beta hydrolase [Myxococcota bacterium]
MYVRVGEVRLYFDVEGAGLVPDGPAMRERPTLLLLHGGPGFDHSSFKPAFAALSDVAQVIYLDHRGQGRSDRGDPDDWRLERWADDVREFCDALGIERPVVLGQSFGGFVAQVYAARHPDHPAKLVLSSTACRFDVPRVLAAFERIAGPEVREAASRFWADPGPDTVGDYMRVCMPHYSRSAQDPDGLPRTRFHMELTYAWNRAEGLAMDLRPLLGAIRCPTLVMAGELDPITPIEAAEELQQALPSGVAELARFADAGHGVYRDLPEPYFERLRRFLRG